MAHINTFNNQPGAIFTDNSITVNAQQNNTQVCSQTTIAPDAEDKQPTTSGTNKSRPIYFSGKRGQKIDLFRVILALHECGFFSDGNGGKPRQEDVFNAFGTMLHEDFSGFQKNLHEASLINNDSKALFEVFAKLHTAYKSYIDSK